MKYFMYTGLSLISLLILLSCKDPEDPSLAPANLEVTANISEDGSGEVLFTATADNAISFDFEFGNGEAKTSSTGIITYTYNTPGTQTYPVTVTAKSSSSQKIKKTINITVTVGSSDPTLYWSDEFGTNGAPDPTKWGYDLGTGDGGWGNSELQYYTSRSNNVIVEGGVLKIKAIKENYSGSEYTSARILSKGKFDFKYGRIETRAKLPAGAGTWPAIWMLGSDISTAGWPGCGEIDIMEHRGSELNKIFGTLHYPGHSGGNADGNTKMISNATTEFHIYSVDWTASYIKIYVDDQLIHSVVNSESIPFNHNFFFIINIAMGGTFGGSVDPAFTEATMEVDYIRVFK